MRYGFIEDPARCHFDPPTIRCPAKEDCAAYRTQAQVETARRICAGAKFADGKPVYPGFKQGSRLHWGTTMAGPNPPGINNVSFQSMVFENPTWDYRTFGVDRDTRPADAKVGALVNVIDPDLRRFKEHGSKPPSVPIMGGDGDPPAKCR